MIATSFTTTNNSIIVNQAYFFKVLCFFQNQYLYEAYYRKKTNNVTYEGFLKEGDGGPILGVTFDCFAHHMQDTLDISNVAFVKLDVEGFEIAVLKGAQNSLFKHGYSKVGGMAADGG